jgi:glycosyltransferase involved in cell wall biosynthesis
MRVALGIPFWGNDPDRLKAYSYVVDRLLKAYPFDEFYNLPPGLHGRGASRNWIARAASGCDVVVLCDADTIPEPDALRSAIYGAMTHGGQHFAYDSYQYLSKYGTELWYTGHDHREHLDMEGPGSYGGVFAMRPEEYWFAGGMPELEGWGFEDIIFAIQTRTFLRDAKWHPGSITHLWHPSAVSVGSEQYNRNIAVCKRFESADRDRDQLATLILMGVGNHDTSRMA